MKNVKENKRRWKQLVAIFIVAVMLFTTPHIVGFASMGKEEATTAAADGNPDNSDVKVQSEDADSEEVKSVYLIATRDLSNLWLQFFLSQNQGFMRLFEKTVLK